MSFISIFSDFEAFSQMIPDNVIYMIRILIAAACGGFIGIERTKRQKDAGTRTHLIVAIGAALLMLISKYAFFDVVGLENLRLQADVSRIASQVVSGVSFLGAGVIFARDTSVRGLTTAAGIWATAGVGMAIGSGMITIGIFSTLLIIGIQIMLHKYALRHEAMMPTYIKVTLKNNTSGSLERFIHCLNEHKVDILSQKIKRKDNTFLVTLSVKMPKGVKVENLASLLEEDDEIVLIDI